MWLTAIWSVSAGATLTLGLMHIVEWARQRETTPNLLFGIAALSTAVLAGFELLMMSSNTPEALGLALRWAHVPTTTLHISLIGFAYLYLGPTRRWLAGTIVGLRLLNLAVNFAGEPNVNFIEITGLGFLQLLDQSVAVPVGIPSPWTYLGPLSVLLTVLFLADASLSLWRRGDPNLQRRALMVGGSLTTFFLLALAHTLLMYTGILRIPYLTSPFFLLFIVVMSIEMVGAVLRSASLDAELRESRVRFDLAADAAGLGLVTWDVQPDRFMTTDRSRKLLGLGPGDNLGLSDFLQVVHPADRPMVRQVLHSAVEKTGSYDCQFRVRHQDGGIRWVTSRGSIDLDGRTRPVRLRGVVVDSTERKHAELELQARRAELNHLSRVGTAGKLSASIVHELNQPLTTILSNAQAAQRLLGRNPVDNDLLHETIGDIISADRRATEIIRRLRTLLMKDDNEFQPVDINSCVLEVTEVVRDELMNAGITLKTDLRAGDIMVSCDRVQIQQVVLNIVMNAVDAMAGQTEGERRITVRTQLDDQQQVVVSISDTGCGIAPLHLPNVFEPFFTTKSDGMGMGLAVCRDIISAHGGRLEVDKPREGETTFRFALSVLETANA